MAKSKTMTLERFFELLPRTGWGFIGTSGRLRRSEQGVLSCPVCAVYNRLAKRRGWGANLSVFSWSAGAVMGLPESLVDQIVEAADSTRMSALRLRLLKHCGLDKVSK